MKSKSFENKYVFRHRNIKPVNFILMT
jgi:hypothetical protein